MFSRMKRVFSRNSRRHLIVLLCALSFGFSFYYPGTLVSAVLAWVFVGTLTHLFAKRQAGYFLLFTLGLVCHLISVYWLAETIERFGKFSTLLAWSATLLLFCTAASQLLVFKLVASLISSRLISRLHLRLALSWTITELYFPRFIPWTLGNTQLAFTPLAQVAEIVGASGISFLMFWWAELSYSLLIPIIQKGPKVVFKRFSVSFWTLALSFCIVLSFGFWRIQNLRARYATLPQLHVGIVQGNLDPVHDFHYNKRDINASKYASLSETFNSQSSLDLIVWPESAVGYDYFVHDKFISGKSGRDPLPKRSAAFLFGGQAKLTDFVGREARYHNSAIMLLAEGTVAGMYHKQILFPFSETWPLSSGWDWLKRFYEKKYLVVAGENQQPLLFSPPLKSALGQVSLGALICYEDLFPELLRPLVRNGAQVIVGLSNDNWFGTSHASRQHHLLASFRAIEARRYLVRATTNGVSGFIDPFGRTFSEAPRFTEAILQTTQVRPISDLTLYTRYGNQPLKLLLWFLVLLGFFSEVFFSRASR